MKEFELYIEDYDGKDEYLGTYLGNTFLDAVTNWLFYGVSDPENFDSSTLTYQGCKIYEYKE